MEKILLIVDGINPSTNALDFACYLARVTQSKLNAVFLENLINEERSVLNVAPAKKSTAHSPALYYNDHNAKVKLIEENIQRVKDACINRGVNFFISRDRGIPIDEIIEESRYADVLVIDATTTFGERFEGAPSQFVKDVLTHAECPVIIAPETFDAVDELVFSYDGSASSVFAIKQFTHILPHFRHTKVNIIQVMNDESLGNPDHYLFTKWLQAHYSDLHFEVLKGKTETELFEYLFKKKNVFVVMGAYSRNMLSQMLRKSHADLIIKTVTQPIFIAHP